MVSGRQCGAALDWEGGCDFLLAQFRVVNVSEFFGVVSRYAWPVSGVCRNLSPCASPMLLIVVCGVFVVVAHSVKGHRSEDLIF